MMPRSLYPAGRTSKPNCHALLQQPLALLLPLLLLLLLLLPPCPHFFFFLLLLLLCFELAAALLLAATGSGLACCGFLLLPGCLGTSSDIFTSSVRPERGRGCGV
jgi:hypothetical protein